MRTDGPSSAKTLVLALAAPNPSRGGLAHWKVQELLGRVHELSGKKCAEGTLRTSLTIAVSKGLVESLKDGPRLLLWRLTNKARTRCAMLCSRSDAFALLSAPAWLLQAQTRARSLVG